VGYYLFGLGRRANLESVGASYGIEETAGSVSKFRRRRKADAVDAACAGCLFGVAPVATCSSCSHPLEESYIQCGTGLNDLAGGRRAALYTSFAL
jgi:hypothetical protein